MIGLCFLYLVADFSNKGLHMYFANEQLYLTQSSVRGVINKFVHNVCHFFNKPPVEILFANKIVWLICYKLGKYFSNAFRNI